MGRAVRILFFILCFCLAASLSSFSYAEKIEIIAIRGTVEILPKGESAWVAASKGMVLGKGDRVRTGRNSQCDAAFGGRLNTVGILENSDVIILLKGSEKIEIVDANIYAELKAIPMGSAFEIRTPTAVCGARGTSLGLKGNRENTEATAYKKNIYVKNASGEKKTIKEGYARNIDKEGRISDEITARAENIERFNSWRGDIERISKSETRAERKEGAAIGNVEESVSKSEDIIDKKGQKADETRTEKSGVETTTSSSSGGGYTPPG